MKTTTMAGVLGVVLAAGLVAAGPGWAAEASPQVAGVVAGGNDFAMDLYARLAEVEKGNLFYSPSSIHTALAMTYAGARGQTAEQMAKTLRFALPAEKLSAAFGKLLGVLNNPRKDYEKKPVYELVMADALWAQKGYPFRKEFIELVRADYHAALEELDFTRQPDPSRTRINDWVAQQTKDKIKDLIPQGCITPLTRLVLTNAIYFKSNWAEQFRKANTRPQPFRLIGGDTVRTPMMNQQRRFGYMETASMQLLEMPYRYGDLSMVVLLPRTVAGIAAMEKVLSAKALAGWLKQAQARPVQVTLPKFTYTCSFSLNDVLKAMGMTDAFIFKVANFTGMTTAEDLFISDVLHKAFVAVDEEGTEAAAATAVVMRAGAAPRPEPPKVFKADHPFIFLIQHKATGAILFVGRVMKPEA